MKKIIFLLMLLTAFTSTLKAQNTIDRIIAKRHDVFESNIWKGYDSSVFTRNADGYITNNLTSKTDANLSWNNFQKSTTTYNLINQKTSEILENWNGSSWINFNKYAYTYDGNFNLVLTQYYTWNGSTWNNVGRITNTGYDTLGNCGQIILSNLIGSNWVDFQKTDFTYLVNTKLKESETKYLWNNSLSALTRFQKLNYTYNQDSIGTILLSTPDSNNNWRNEKKDIYTYSFNPQKVTESKTQIWDTTSSPAIWQNKNHTLYFYTITNKLDHSISEKAITATQWEAQYQNQFTYDANDSITEYYDQWNINNVWENSTKKTKTFVGNYVSQENNFIGNGSNWNDFSRLHFLYDANNNKTFQQIDSFKNGTFIESYRDYFYYGTFPLAISTIASSIKNIVVYPNPATEIVTINFSSDKYLNAKILISDITGKTRIQILQPIFKGENKIKITINSLETGTYILSISDNEGNVFNQKIQVIK